MPATTLTPPIRRYLNEAVERGFGEYSTLHKRIASGELPAERVRRRDLILASDLEAPIHAMGTGRAGLVVGFDTEFTTTGPEARVVNSHQFAVQDVLNPALMVRIVFLRLDESRISLHTALWEAVIAAGLWHSSFVPTASTSGECAATWCLISLRTVRRAMPHWNGQLMSKTETHNCSGTVAVPIVVASHFGSACLMAFRISAFVTDHLTPLTSAGGGRAALLPCRLQHSDGGGDWLRPLSVAVLDTMCHALTGQKTLAGLGCACGVLKFKGPGRIGLLEFGISGASILVE